MEWKNIFKILFGDTKKPAQATTWKEVGSYQSTFYGFGTDIYADDLVRSCIRALAEHSSKARARSVRQIDGKQIPGDKRLEKMIQFRPNMYMNGKDMLYKIRTRLEQDNTSFVFIQRDETGKCVGLYPVPKATQVAKEYQGRLYISFRFLTGMELVAPWEDLAVLRKDYDTSDIFGASNDPILTTLENRTTVQTGLTNAIESTANLRGILKSTKGMIDPADLKKTRDQFVTDYMSIANEGGIAALDGTTEFKPIELKPATANYKHFEEIRNNIYRYFGVNDDILMSKVSGDEYQAFYEARLEPFLLALGLELTNKIFTERERGFGNEIVFESNRMQYVSMANKLKLVQMVDRGAMTPNEWREVMNLAPIKGGDEPIRRLDTAVVDDGKKDGETDPEGGEE